MGRRIDDKKEDGWCMQTKAVRVGYAMEDDAIRS
jgi:hypothetical protein